MLRLHYFNILNDHFLCLNMNYVIRESQISERWPKTHIDGLSAQQIRESWG